MNTRGIHPEVAQLTASIASTWRKVESALTGGFTTAEGLARADDALASLLNSQATEMRLLRQRVRAEIAAMRSDERALERPAA